jgi:dTDP-4-amino-4,6-dideoxygalactose transaminase
VEIPFNDLKAQYAAIQKEVDEAITSALRDCNFIRGREVKSFEQKFAEIVNAKYCISTGSGTGALFAILKSLGIGLGDEVVTPSFSWISSAETITFCGAKPVFADVDDRYYTIDLSSIQRNFTAKTKAVVVVHLFGQAADIRPIQAWCKKNKLWLIEDCAQAHLTKCGDQYVGTFGDVAAFSFYPTKNLGAYGDAGCVVTDNDTIASHVKRLINHGALDKDDHLIEGMNSRMDTLQAAVLLAKLPYLNAWNQRRIDHANLYKENLAGINEIVLPAVRENTTHTFHLFVIRAKHRDRLKAYLQQQGIQTIIHYPRALHNLPAYQRFSHQPEDFPISNTLQQEVLSLPVNPELKEKEIHYICTKIREFYNK